MSRTQTPPAEGLIRARIEAIHDEAPDIKSFQLDYGAQPFRFLPGQWIDLVVGFEDGYQTGGYSVTSTPLEFERLQLAIKAARRHPVTRYLHEDARLGDEVWISQGQGHFWFKRGTGHRLVLLGAGIGVTPLISILRYVYRAAPDVAATLVYGVRQPEDILFRDELDAMAAASSRIACIYTVSEPPAAWRGHTGRIDRELLQALTLPRAALYYYCGAPGFVEAMTRDLGALGIAAEQLVYERWW